MASRACASEIDSASSDSVTPGEMTLTLMSPDCSLRSPSEMAQTANLVAEYTAAVGSTSLVPMEATLTMRPLPWARITGRAALIPWSTPRMFTSIIRFHSSTLSSARADSGMTPALLIMTSTPP
jgi:hypothetical protein